MKKLKLVVSVTLFMVLLVSLFGIASAVTSTSMRLTAMSPALVNIVADEYSDLHSYSVSLLDIDGYRLYTEHSNIINGSNRLNQLYNQNSIGFVGELFGYKVGAYYNQKLEGSLADSDETNYTRNYDDDSITKTTELSATTSKKDSSEVGILLAKSVSDKLDFGIKLRGNFQDNSSTAYLEELEVNQTRDIDEQNTSEEDLIDKRSSFLVETTLRSAIGSGITTVGIGISPQFVTYESTESEAGLLRKQSNSAFGLGLNLKAKHELPGSLFGKPAVFSLGGNLSRSGSKHDDVSTRSEVTETISGDRVTKRFTDQETVYNIATKDAAYGLHIGSEIQMNANTILGIGIKVNHSSAEDIDTAKERVIEHKVEVSEADTIDEASSYTEKIIQVPRYSLSNNNSRLVVQVPFGMETKLSDSFTIRLGATSTFYNKRVVSSTYEGGTMDRKAYTREYRDGSTFKYDEEIGMVTYKTVDEVTDITSQTMLNFGFGYEINEHVSVDFITQGDFTNLNNLRLSLNLKL